MANSSQNTIRAIIFLAVALVAGGFGVVLIFQYFASYQQQIEAASREEHKRWGIVASGDLYQGVAIQEEDIYAVQIPPRFMPMWGSPEAGMFDSPERVIGRYPRERILANEFLREDRLSNPEEGIGLNAIIPRGMRALSLSVGGPAALTGFLRPGNYVDILLSLRNPHTDEAETIVFMQAVYVLAVGDDSNQETERKKIVIGQPTQQRKLGKKKKKKGGGAGTVTFAVTPSAAEELAHAEKIGRLTLLLRNDLDFDIEDNSAVGIRDIVVDEDAVADSKDDEKDPIDTVRLLIEKKAAEAAAASPEPQSRFRTVQFIQGGNALNVPQRIEPETSEDDATEDDAE